MIRRDALLVVVRWYGGIKLGKGGLARAYAAVAGGAVEQAVVEERAPTALLCAEAPYAAVGALQRLVSPPGVVLHSAAYGERVEVVLEVHLDRVPAILEALRNLGIQPAILSEVGEQASDPART
ncbi:MAG TPA: DUF1949 domain-containing protein [Thermoanaerobaculia bacterium]|nr:DUF1949 domain-containing protein [Thermoanaerobaculia bacterium]